MNKFKKLMFIVLGYTLIVTCIIVMVVSFKDKNIKDKEYKVSNYLNNDHTFKFNKDLIYLIVGEEKEIEYTSAKNMNYKFQSENPEILKIEGNKMIGLKPGKTEVYPNNSKKSLTVVVTDLLKKAELKEVQKPTIPCGYYTKEQNELLDQILKSKIDDVGVKTRAAAVTAARFLALEFPYQIPYFYENGRVHSSGVNYVDGEGRYYHQGLYLNEYKFESIKASISGPATWGCPLTNWEDDPEWGYYYGVPVPNGLDCSGFLAWVLYNVGFNPGDIGAGETEYPYQMTDLGEFTLLTKELINSKTIKAGDLLNFWGHISIIVGIDNNHYYVAESLQNFKGLIVKAYPKQEVMDTFKYVVLMDSYYKKDGNYTEHWNELQ